MRALARLCSLAVVMAVALPASAENIGALLEKADMVYRGKSSAAVFDMTIKTSSSERSYKVVVWGQDGAEDRVLIKLLGPALWRGFGTLKVGDSLQLYDPKSNHVTVVSHSMLGNSWMGSHFSNDDLVKETRLQRDYHVKLIAKAERDTGLGYRATHYRLELTPKPRAPVVWGRIVYELWARGDAAVPLRILYFRRANDREPARTMTFADVREFDGRMAPASMKVTVADQPGEYTRIVYQQIKFDVRIPDNKFTEQALRH